MEAGVDDQICISDTETLCTEKQRLQRGEWTSEAISFRRSAGKLIWLCPEREVLVLVGPGAQPLLPTYLLHLCPGTVLVPASLGGASWLGAELRA